MLIEEPNEPPSSQLSEVPGIFLLDWFDLVWFYGISNIIGYLMPNSLYTIY